VRVLLTTIGSSGDINPFIALARRLKTEGHDPVLAVNPYFRDPVERAGIAYREFGVHLSPVEFATEHPSAFGRFFGPIVLFRKIFIPMAEQMYRRLDELCAEVRPDLLVGHQISFGLPWAAEERGIPWVTCPLAPATVPSVADPNLMPVGSDLHRMPEWYRRSAVALQRRTVSALFDGAFNRVRRRVGVRARRDTMFGEMLGGDAVLAMWSPSWRGPAPDDPPTLTICGFPWFDLHDDEEHEEGIEPRLRSFLDAGEAPVVFAFGSVLSHTSHDAFAEAVHACERIGRRGVLVTGSAGSAPRDLPGSVMAVDYAPYSVLFLKAGGVVQPGGVGTTAHRLRAGVPTVVLPHAHDQFDNAARCERHGVSLTVRRHGVSGRRLAEALERVLSDASMRDRARAMGDRVRREDGTGVAVGVLERIMGFGRPMRCDGREPAPA